MSKPSRFLEPILSIRREADSPPGVLGNRVFRVVLDLQFLERAAQLRHFKPSYPCALCHPAQGYVGEARIAVPPSDISMVTSKKPLDQVRVAVRAFIDFGTVAYSALV
jgi:hypothetical protein